MSINGALQIGQSAILASQAAIQVAGNNMANASTPGYHRQIARLSPSRPEFIGRAGFIGTGVQLSRIVRSVDSALQSRTRSAISDQNAAEIDSRFLNAIESVRNELTSQDLSSRLSAFFNSFSELSNSPNDEAVRTVVIQQGSGLATAIRELRTEHTNVRTEIDRALGATVRTVDGLLEQVAEVNRQIVEAEQGTNGGANALRDRRDELVAEVAQYLPINTIEQPNGALDIHVGSTPIVLAGDSRGVVLRTEASASGTTVSLTARRSILTLDKSARYFANEATPLIQRSTISTRSRVNSRFKSIAFTRKVKARAVSRASQRSIALMIQRRISLPMLQACHLKCATVHLNCM